MSKRRKKIEVIDDNQKMSNNLEKGFQRLLKDISNDNCYFFWWLTFSFMFVNFLMLYLMRISIDCFKTFLETHNQIVDKGIALIPSQTSYAILQIFGAIAFTINIDNNKIKKFNYIKLLQLMGVIWFISSLFLVIIYISFSGNIGYIKSIGNNFVLFSAIIIIIYVACKFNVHYFDKFIPCILLFILHVLLGNFNNLSISQWMSTTTLILIFLGLLYLISKSKWKPNWFLKVVNKKQFVCLFSILMVISNPLFYIFFMSSFFAKNLSNIIEDVKDVDIYSIIKSIVDLAINIFIIVVTYCILNMNIDNMSLFSYIFIDFKYIL